MKKLTVLAATALLSTTAFAGNHTVYSEANLQTDGFNSKAAAYQAGFDYSDALHTASGSELRFKLAPIGENVVSNITLDDTAVTIEEFSEARGEISYRAIVNVDYHFDARDSNND
ncbi:DUF3316 domain-containing protein [Vibrio sp. TH_r3]|uniref:DUF3316 domain-containing protein n=1 Tax=Vibrio sp. TH_r3 TaxID=3082084 RepID=UPI002954F1D2|nr:DUF3316 domain-containing protein [Vibrio sp. TH_r3]MDV7106361.1 DUF3316 domain-containing protein [Vibrio sp. TH_r3]